MVKMNIAKLTLMCFILACFLSASVAQQQSTPTILTLKYINYNGLSMIESNLSSKLDGKTVFLEDFEIEFSYLQNDSLISLKKVNTDFEGNIVVPLPNDLDNFKNDNGYIHFKAKFQGNDKFKGTSADIAVKEVLIALNFVIVDSVKMIDANAWEIGKNKVKEKIDNKNLYFFSPSLFGDLPIGSGWLADGKCSIEFPTDLPGDSIGTLEILAKFTDVDEYGNVTYQNSKDWGKPFIDTHGAHTPKLWTTDPPLWMLIALICLMIVIWSHYFYIFYRMYKIRRKSKTINEG